MEHMMSGNSAEKVGKDITVTKGKEDFGLNGRYYDPARPLG
jgi:hypothetical protein